MYSPEFLNHQQKFDNLQGKKFGRLLVIDLLSKNKHSIWNCICDCGNKTQVRADSLKNGKVVSCGCYHLEIVKKGKTSEEVLIKSVFNSYRNRANKKNIPFELNIDEFKKLIFSPCEYCGSLPSNIQYHKTDPVDKLIYNGIDRIDSFKGYFLDNCVSSCIICNRAKGILSTDDFLNWLSKAYNFSSKKENRNEKN